MRKHFTTLLLIVSASLTYGQQPISIIHEQVIGNSIDTTYISYYFYNQGNDLAYEYTQVNISGEFQNDEKWECGYGNGGTLTETYYSGWDNNTQQWSYLARTNNTYNSDFQIITSVSQEKTGLVWVNSAKTETTYNVTTGLKESMISSYWNATDNVWVSTGRQDYIFNADEQLTQYKLSGWNDVSMDWVASYKSDYSYNSFGKVDQELQYTIYNGDWYNGSKEVYVYNSDQLLDTKTRLIYNEQYDLWGSATSISFTYNTDGTIHQDFFASFDEALGFMVPQNRNTHIYSDAPLGLETVSTNAFSVFPNPAQDVVQISFAQSTQASIMLTDLQGKMIRSTFLAGQLQTVSLEGLPAGVFLLSVTQNDRTETRRIVKK